MPIIPPITIDPDTVVTWEMIRKAWHFAISAGIVAREDYPIPSIATYPELINMINAWLGAQSGGVLRWGDVLPQVADNTRALVAATASDPSQVATISAQPLEDVVTTGGSVGTVIATIATGTYGKINETIAAATAVCIAGATVAGALLVPESKDDLVFSIDDLADENGDVAVYFDEEGTTYLPEEVIERIRTKLVDMGVYDSVFTPTEEALDYAKSISTAPHWDAMDVELADGKTIYWGGSLDEISVRYGAPFGLLLVNPNDYSQCIWVMASTEPFSFSQHLADLEPTHWIDVGEDKKVNINGVDIYLDSGLLGSPIVPTSGTMPYMLTTDTSTAVEQAVAYVMCTARMSPKEPGISPMPNVPLPTDLSQPIGSYYPDWDAKKKTFKSVVTDDEGKPIGITDTNWYPARFNDPNGLDSDSSMSLTDAQSGNTPDNRNVIEDLIRSIQDLYNDLTTPQDDPAQDPSYPNPYPTPTIPVDDGGDTPPAEPPVISGSANGLWAIYNPTLAQVQDFGAYLWSENILDQITRMFNSPIDAVIGFHMIYCTPIKGPARNIKCGYLDTGVSSITVANQYATIDCGTIDVPEFYGTVLDYTATKLALYLPFIGIVPLDTAVCMGSRLQVIYRIDVLTGTCLAQVKVIKENSNAVMYAFEGNCAVQIPLTATTYTGTVTALINGVSAGLSTFTGDYISAGQDMSEAVSGIMSKSGVKQSGSMGANAGALGIRIPYLIITHPVAYDAYRYQNQYGYPLNQTVVLGSLSGYTRVKDIHLAGIPCTDDELEQIESLLKDGVIIN